MADVPYDEIIPNVTNGLNASVALNKVGNDDERSVRFVSAVAQAGAELGYYVTGSYAYAAEENRFYRYDGNDWVVSSNIVTSAISGVLTDLVTTNKTTLVAAINEVKNFVLNGGTIGGATTVTGLTAVVANVSSSTGALSALRVDASAYDGAGSQWAGIFPRIYTVSGQSGIGQLSGILTALYHDEGFTVSEWQGIESGAAYVSGAGTVLTDSWGIAPSLPVVSDGASVVRAAGIRIKPMATTGIGTVYAILSELVATSFFSGKLEVNNVSVAIDAHRSGGAVVIQNTAYQDHASSGGIFTSRFARGTVDVPVQVNSNDLISQFTAQAYIDGGFRTVGSLQFLAAATPGVGSYPSKFYLRLIADGSTTLTARAIFEGDGGLTLGTSSKVGSGVFYGGRVALGKNAAGAMLDIYADAADCVGIIVNSRNTPTQPLAQFKQDTVLKLVVGVEGILEYKGTMGDSSKNPTTDAPTDWVQVVVGTSTYYLPAYAA